MPRLLLATGVAAAICIGWSLNADEPPPGKGQGTQQPPRTPWGSDHVGKPFPQYMTGDECLFCHRTIGPSWTTNLHQTTVRPAADDDPAMTALRHSAQDTRVVAEVTHLLGSERATRFLKRSRAYGKLDLLPATFLPPPPESVGRGKLTQGKSAEWDTKTFGERCAGCHATAVDVRSRAFAAVSLDCFTCHGDVDRGHTTDISRVLLSTKRRPARQVVSICGQCHLRGGTSTTSQLPYPNTFVAGDNLLRDFQVDLSTTAIQALPAIERHIYLNVRDVASGQETQVNCLSCHTIHQQRTAQHTNLPRTRLCASCHQPNGTALLESISKTPRNTPNRVCDY